jgi:hypothetical protein
MAGRIPRRFEERKLQMLLREETLPHRRNEPRRHGEEKKIETTDAVGFEGFEKPAARASRPWFLQ